jgi:hypothetical protein
MKCRQCHDLWRSSSSLAALPVARETLQQSPVVQKMMELSKQQKMLSREQQVEMQQEMMKLMKEAVQMQKAGQAKAAAAEPRCRKPGGDARL